MDDLSIGSSGKPNLAKPSIPVFVISYNRGKMLQRCISYLQALDAKITIVIYDNGSFLPNTVDMLNYYESTDITVVRSTRIYKEEDLELMADFIQQYCRSVGLLGPYVVTDCDIDLSPCRLDLLDILNQLLIHYPEVECAGPMLRIRDIPCDNPVRAHILNRHIDQFWHHLPSFVQLPSGTVAFQYAMIDTTFALHRGNLPFYRPRPGIRVYSPYEAVHLDWYPSCWEPDYGTTSSPLISHWSNLDYLQSHSSELLAWSKFYDVIHDPITSSFTVVEVDID